MLVSEIMARIRSIVADPNGTRWADARIISLINEGQKDIAKQADVLRDEQNVIMHNEQSHYSLHPDTYKVNRAVYDGKKLEFIDNIGMDAINSEWETDTAETPTHLVFDRLNRGIVRLYPIPTFTESDPFDISIAPYFAVNYNRMPTTLTQSTDQLMLSDAYSAMIEYYVSGRLLREDMDSQNRAFGNEQLMLYNQGLVEMVKESSRDFTGNATIYTVPYRIGV